jgi:hypothetical protein
MKIDVDGGESDVLLGSAQTLRRPELRSLVVEVDVGMTERVMPQLDGAGFTLVQRYDERTAGEPLPGVWYGIFERTLPG